MTTAKHWQQSYSGQIITPEFLDPKSVRLADIGHALAQKIRFNGQCTVMGYTVAQHCYLGARQLIKDGQAKFALPFLLHEVGEVYLPDVPSPIKRLLRVSGIGADGDDTIPWVALERQHAGAILEAIGLSSLLPKLEDTAVHECDVRMLLTEKRDLMGPEPRPWGFTEQPYDFKINDIWEPQWAEDRWNGMYNSLLTQHNNWLKASKSYSPTQARRHREAMAARKAVK